MDKKTLNNEIVLCRAAVRKAKVAVIRKILKKMKILKSCKIEAVKEKKLRKSERLFQKVQIMKNQVFFPGLNKEEEKHARHVAKEGESEKKKIKVDEVTKFALRNSDLEPFLKGPKVELRQNALACLAKHNAVAKKITSIREQIPNWETELPLLLDSLGKKRKKLNSKDSIKGNSDRDKRNEKLVEKRDISKPKKVKNVVSKEENTKSGRLPKIDNDSDNSEESDGNISENSSSNASEKVDKVKKIDDPFFIGKKVIAPKLVSQSLPDRKNDKNFSRLIEPKSKRETVVFDRKKSKDFSKFSPQVPKKAAAEEEVLHPSWAAKKVKLIKPFQGKKIKFSDD